MEVGLHQRLSFKRDMDLHQPIKRWWLQDGGGASPEAVLQEGDGPMKTWCIYCHCCWKLSFRMEAGLYQRLSFKREMDQWKHLPSQLLDAVLQDGGGVSSEAVLHEGDGPMKMMHLLSLLLEAGLEDGGGSSSETVLQEGDGPMKTWCIYCHCCWKLFFRMEVVGLHWRMRKWHVTVTVLESQQSALWWGLWGGWQCVAGTCRGCDWTPWCPWASPWTRTWWTLTSSNLHTCQDIFWSTEHKQCKAGNKVITDVIRVVDRCCTPLHTHTYRSLMNDKLTAGMMVSSWRAKHYADMWMHL